MSHHATSPLPILRTNLLRLRKTAPLKRVLPLLLALLLFTVATVYLSTSPLRPLSLAPPPLFGLTPLQQDVRQATAATYRLYLRHCLGKDEIVPTTRRCEDWFNIGLTLLDSLDTLLLMDLRDEYRQSRDWADRHLSFDAVSTRVSTFEIVIRATAGMNSAYQLTGDLLWRRKSVELADYLLLSFNLTATGCPPPAAFIGRARLAMSDEHALDTLHSNPAEAGTLQLEFRTLSQITGDPKYARAVDRCTDSLIRAMPAQQFLVTDRFNLQTGVFEGARVSMSAMVDSFYEMQLKTWVAFGKKDHHLRDAFQAAVARAHVLLFRTEHNHTYVGEMLRGNTLSFKRSMEHLACFLPGTLAYAALHGLGGGLQGENPDDYLPLARALAESCYAMSRGMFHGLAAEVTDFSGDTPRPMRGADHNLLRPEIVEALYYLDKIDPLAGDKYKKWGETMWKAMKTYAQVPGQPDGVLSSTYNLLAQTKEEITLHGKLHSFAIAETYKYLFMLFDDRPPDQQTLPLTKWVYNTEAHPVRIVE
ncbi:mannosyl-oligosaccharide--1,2-mannosidase [Chondrus crispus]|uniref:alpha-1,2-Mannosidase n=1 Tax=Chondrus crispus TaxID=2769 RepID=S0F2U6_CHOCR|nr:mannosyl-oligosaccharide--1,2-mannosidase [Chondrus crispus]CDF77451.1 mannosyl-oligosaccharide--1,2-mannosidase [Chondrus crispus]|eukprot:XP_005712325.1 mannosyl-oligosaccharide--1,2-mannosidase [Chondrus crispus]